MKFHERRFSLVILKSFHGHQPFPSDYASATMSISPQIDPTIASDVMRDSEPSPNSTSTSNARLTPESDSDDSDLEIEDEELGESFKLQPRRTADRGSAEDAGNVYHPRGGRRGSISTVQSFQLYTPDEERTVVRKHDRRLVLFVALLYMLSFLDRSSMFNPREMSSHIANKRV